MSTIHSDRSIAESPLSNGDLAPTEANRRTWGTYDFAALWIGLSIVTTTYTLASGLIAAGMTWWQGLLTVSLGNLIVLIPMLLNAHPGTKYGIPFPVLVRSSFGIRGANVAAMARALVACGWFGIQTWIAALAVDALMTTLWRGWADVGLHKAIAFGFFWLDPACDHPARHRGHPLARAHRRAAADRRQRRAADLGLRRRRRDQQRLHRLVQAGDRRPELLVAVRARPGGQHRLLDHALAQHPRLHPLRAGPEVADRRAVDRDADDDDRVLVPRHRGHRRDDRHLRRGDLGPGRARRAAARRPAGPARPGDDRDRHRAALDQHGGQRRLAVQRLLEPVAAPDLVPHRRPDHGGDRDRLAAVEALRGRRRLHLHLARRLRQPARRVRGRDDRRLLDPAEDEARRPRSLPAWRGGRYWFTNGFNVRALRGGGDRRDPGRSPAS